MFKKIFFAVSLLFCSFSEAKYKVEEFVLDNGLQVIFIRKSPSTVVYFSVWYRCGSLRDFISKSGVAHFLEHMAFETNGREFSNYLEKIGAENNAFTWYNSICFYEIFEKSNLENIAKKEAERMQYIKIDNASFLAEKGAILQERNTRIDNSPWGALMEEGFSNIFNRKGGGIEIIGWKHEIESITKEDLYAYHDKWFAPNNAVLIVVGDIDFSELKRIVKQYFQDIPKKVLPPVPEKKFTPAEIYNVTHYSQKFGGIALQIFYQVPEFSFRKRMALSLAVEALQLQSSDINREISMLNKDQSLRLAYCDYSLAYDFLEVSFTESIHNREYILAMWKYFKSGILSKGISQKELDLVKKKYLIHSLCSQDEISFLGQFIGNFLMSGYKLNDAVSFIEIIQSIALEECQDVLKVVLSKEPSAILEMVTKGLDRE